MGQDTNGFMNSLAAGLDDVLNPERDTKGKKFGFALLVYELDKPMAGRVNYVGNGKREDVLAALKEVVGRWEGRYTEPSTQKQ